MRSRSFVATPPGASIKEQLEDRSMSQKEFALRMGMSEKHISRLINGDVLLTHEMAHKLEIVLGVPSSFWNNLEAIYREKLLIVAEENAMDDDIEIARRFPYSEMAKLGWVENTKDIKERVINLRKFFEVVDLSLLEKEQLSNVATRRLVITEKSDIALLVMAQKARIDSRDIIVAPLNVSSLLSNINEIRKMTNLDENELSNELIDYLTGFGIALSIMPHFKSSYLHGVSFKDGSKIVIGLTQRGKDNDKFWFSLFHELAHIVLGHISKISPITSRDEEDANKWATDTLIPKDKFDDFKNRRDYTRKSVLKFAKDIGIAAGIVVGRLQQESLIKYSELNDLKVKYEFAND